MTYPLRHTIIAMTVIAVSLHLSRPATFIASSRFANKAHYVASRQNAKQSAAKSASSRRRVPTKKNAAAPAAVPVSVAASDRLESPPFVADSARTHHRVEIFAEAGSERGAVRVTLSEAQTIEIVAFNILGKRVADIYSGAARSGINTVSFDLSGFSDGVYICVVRGKNFKTAEKFLVSR